MAKQNITNTLISKTKAADKPFEIRDAGVEGLVLRVQPSGDMTYYFEFERKPITDPDTGKVVRRRSRVRLGSAGQQSGDLTPDDAREQAGAYRAAMKRTGLDPIEQIEAKEAADQAAKESRIAAALAAKEAAEVAAKKAKAENYLRFIEEEYVPYLKTKLRGGIENELRVKETRDQLINRFTDFHDKGLGQITPQDIEKWKAQRLAEGRTPTTINRQLNDLRACLNVAVSWGHLSQSPFEKVEHLKTDKNPKTRFLSQTEEAKLRRALDEREAEIKAARQRGNEWRAERGYDLLPEFEENDYVDALKPAVLMSLNTGLRKGELLNLQWSDIDFKLETLTVDGAGAKSGQSRQVPLNDEALSILKAWKQQTKAKRVVSIKAQEAGYVFPGKKDGQPIQNFRRSWARVLESAKINDFRWHDTRHTFASNLAMQSKDLNVVRELLGHSDFSMTQRYAHLAQEHKKAAVNLLKPSTELPPEDASDEAQVIQAPLPAVVS